MDKGRPRMMLIIGLDGFDWRWRRYLRAADFEVLPFHSPHALSGPAWTSIFTGLRAETHRMKHNTDLAFVAQQASRRPRYLWDHLAAADKESVVVNVPFTYPPGMVRRLLVCGYPCKADQFCFPRAKAADWPWEHLDLYYRHHTLTPQEFMAVDDDVFLEETEESRWLLAHRFLVAVIETRIPDLGVFCLTDLDRLAHYAHRRLRTAKVRNLVLSSLMELLDKLRTRLRPEWMFVVSDHGLDLKANPHPHSGWALCHGPNVPSSHLGVFAYWGRHARPLGEERTVELEDAVPTWLYLMDAPPAAAIEGRAHTDICADAVPDTAAIREQLAGLGYVD